MATTTSALPTQTPSSARNIPRRRKASRVPTTLWVAAVAGILAVVGWVWSVAVIAPRGVPVVIAAHDLALGEPVGPDDFVFADASLPPTALALVLRPPDVAGIDGQTMAHAVKAGEVVGRSDLGPSAGSDRQRAMSIPIDPSHAVGGRLQRGDLVDVVDSSSGAAVYVVVGAPVLDIGVESGRGSGLGGGSTKYALTIGVDDKAALRLSAAIAGGKIEVVRSTGAAAPVVGR